jgi:chromosome segregation ATPase
MDFYASTPKLNGEKVINTQLMSALGVWGDSHQEKLAVQENWLSDLDSTGDGTAEMRARVEGFVRALGLAREETAEKVTGFVRGEVEELRKKYSEVLGMMKVELRLSSERIVDDKEQIKSLKDEIEQLQKRIESAGGSDASGAEVEALQRSLREARKEVAELRKEQRRPEQGPSRDQQEMETSLESIRMQYGQFRQDVTARLEEKNKQIKRLEEENQSLRSTANGSSDPQVAGLKEQCRNHSKERTALMTILDSKIRTLVESISRTMGDLPSEVASHPRFSREVHALEKLVGATIQAMKATEEAESKSR